jgi:hypothetical protein
LSADLTVSSSWERYGTGSKFQYLAASSSYVWALGASSLIGAVPGDVIEQWTSVPQRFWGYPFGEADGLAVADGYVACVLCGDYDRVDTVAV